MHGKQPSCFGYNKRTSNCTSNQRHVVVVLMSSMSMWAVCQAAMEYSKPLYSYLLLNRRWSRGVSLSRVNACGGCPLRYFRSGKVQSDESTIEKLRRKEYVWMLLLLKSKFILRELYLSMVVLSTSISQQLKFELNESTVNIVPNLNCMYGILCICIMS
jgi:hypothetical protein